MKLTQSADTESVSPTNLQTQITEGLLSAVPFILRGSMGDVSRILTLVYFFHHQVLIGGLYNIHTSYLWYRFRHKLLILPWATFANKLHAAIMRFPWRRKLRSSTRKLYSVLKFISNNELFFFKADFSFVWSQR